MLKKRICLIGNCQMLGLVKFLTELSPNIEAKWIDINNRWQPYKWTHDVNIFSHQYMQYRVCDSSKAKEAAQTTDIIIYQPNFLVNKFIEKNITQQNIIKITLSPIFVNDIDFVIRKENKYNCNIKVSEIIKNNQDKKLYIKQDNHISTFLSLEIVRHICDIINVSFYSTIEYNRLLATQYPNFKE